VVICLDRGADLHMAQLMPLPLTVSCFSKIQIGFTFLVPAHPGSPGKRAVKRVCVCVFLYNLIRYCCAAVGKILTDTLRRAVRSVCGSRASRCLSNRFSFLGLLSDTAH